MPESQTRINAFLARAGLGSRRGVEELVRSGRVSVNGELITSLATTVAESDEVRVDGRPVHPERQMLYYLLHKPPGVITTQSDPEGRPTVADLVRELIPGRVVSAGRLDLRSSGALILSNDGDFVQYITHPSNEIEKEYLVSTGDLVTEEVMEQFRRGVKIGGILYRCSQYEIRGRRTLRIVLTEGRNREIRRVLEHFNIEPLRVHRTRIGPVQLAKLRPATVRRLTPRELRGLGYHDRSA